MKRFVAGVIVGIIIAAAGSAVYRSISARAPQPAAQLVNEPTKARQVRQLRPGLDKDQRWVEIKPEKH
jgi:hypothetical protein